LRRFFIIIAQAVFPVYNGFHERESLPMPDPTLERLLEGNRRYIAHRSALDESPRRRIEVARGQKPLAAVFGCVDSRVPPELVFDQGLGDLFVVRTAGIVLDQAVLGSLEFGVQQFHIPLLVVLGHAYCGAVKAAIDVLDQRGKAEADIEYLVQALGPAVEGGKHLGGDLWEQAMRVQVALQVEQLRSAPILAAAVECGALRVVGAWYNLDSGLVEITLE
jgi:carbonic anhydrase